MTDYAVSAGANDGTYGTGGSAPNLNGTTLEAQINAGVGADTFGQATIDTSAIGTDTISAVTVYWYHQQYLKNKSVGYSRKVAVGGTTVFDDTGTPSAGWASHALTSGEFSLINKTGNTNVTFDVDDPGALNYRKWDVRAWDYDSGASAVYLAITHAAAGAPPRTTILRV